MLLLLLLLPDDCQPRSTAKTLIIALSQFEERAHSLHNFNTLQTHTHTPESYNGANFRVHKLGLFLFIYKMATEFQIYYSFRLRFAVLTLRNRVRCVCWDPFVLHYNHAFTILKVYTLILKRNDLPQVMKEERKK